MEPTKKKKRRKRPFGRMKSKSRSIAKLLIKEFQSAPCTSKDSRISPEAMAEVRFTSYDAVLATTKKLIAEVRARPQLYERIPDNKKRDEYKPVMEELWSQVAFTLNMSVKEAQWRWASLRCQYLRNVRRQVRQLRTPSGLPVSSWYLAQDLDFLKEHLPENRVKPKTESPAAETDDNFSQKDCNEIKIELDELEEDSEREDDFGESMPLEQHMTVDGAANIGDGTQSRPSPELQPTSTAELTQPLIVAVRSVEQQDKIDILDGLPKDTTRTQTMQTTPQHILQKNLYLLFFTSIYPEYKMLSPANQGMFLKGCANLLRDLGKEDDT